MSKDKQEYEVDHPHRRRLPRKRQSRTYSFSVAQTDGYMHIGLYEDGTPGEIFLKIAKQGSTLGSFADAVAIACSMALQYGTPLEALCAKYIGWRFEPDGHTDDPDLPKAASILDYIFRRLALDFLDVPSQRRVGIL